MRLFIALLALIVLGAFAGTAHGSTLKQKVYTKVNQTHAHQRRLKQPKTPYAHNVSVYALRQWTSHEALWRRRMNNPHWVLRAVMPANTISTFNCIITRESNWAVTADNPTSTANGLLQILGGPKTVWGNLMLGRVMYNQRGFQPWSAAGIPGIPTCGIS